jgi:hypothetical protein
MRLAEFIPRAMDDILAEWEAFAGTLLPGSVGMTPLALRDHAQQILEAVAADLSSPQTRTRSRTARRRGGSGRPASVPGAWISSCLRKKGTT